ncbi:UNVERIFIED_CONTAM: hypothetical protein FKN15_013569 [Acipenser sinensis]
MFYLSHFIFGSFVRPPLVIISVDGFRASYMMKGSNVIPNIDKLRDTHWVEDECEEIKSPECPAGFVRPPLVIISVDGFRASYMMKGSNVIPNIDKLRSCGTHSPYMRPVYPTKTFPNLYTLATIWITAEKQGVKAGTLFWPFVIPLERRVLTMLQWFNLPDSERPYVYAFHSEQPDQVGHKHGPLSTEVSIKLYFNRKNVKHLLQSAYAEQRPYVYAFHSEQPDQVGHKHGPLSNEVSIKLYFNRKNVKHLLQSAYAEQRPAVLFRTKYSILYHSDFISGYNDALSMPLWTSYTVTKQADVSHIPDSLSSCVRPDIRVPPANSQTCSAYKADKQMSYGYLYPPQLASSPEARYDAFLITNAVPMYPAFKKVWNYFQRVLVKRYATERNGVNVISGPIFDYDYDSLYDTSDKIKHERPAVPTTTSRGSMPADSTITSNSRSRAAKAVSVPTPPPLPPTPAEGEFLLVPPPPPTAGAEQQELSLSPPQSPAGECLLVPPSPAEGEFLLVPPPPAEGACLLVPPPSSPLA